MCERHTRACENDGDRGDDENDDDDDDEDEDDDDDACVTVDVDDGVRAATATTRGRRGGDETTRRLHAAGVANVDERRANVVVREGRVRTRVAIVFTSRRVAFGVEYGVIELGRRRRDGEPSAGGTHAIANNRRRLSVRRRAPRAKKLEKAPVGVNFFTRRVFRVRAVAAPRVTAGRVHFVHHHSVVRVFVLHFIRQRKPRWFTSMVERGRFPPSGVELFQDWCLVRLVRRRVQGGIIKL